MSGSNVKLKKFLLRYYPPGALLIEASNTQSFEHLHATCLFCMHNVGIILQYERDGVMKQKPIDLLDLSIDVDVEVRIEVTEFVFMSNIFLVYLGAGSPLPNHQTRTPDQ